MNLAKRAAVLLFAAVALLLLYHSRPRDYRSTVQNLSQKVGLGEYLEDEVSEDVEANIEPQSPATSHQPSEPLHDDNGKTDTPLTASSFAPGIPKSYGENYTRAFITGRRASENATWLDPYLEKDKDLVPHVYVVDDLSAPLHTPMNKGNEAMIYLTYILDNYDNLSDVNIFMHNHRTAWHTPDILSYDAFEVLTRLSSERVTREGYMNLRCHWDPGCPERLHPGNSYEDRTKLEEQPVARAWVQLFPDDPIPDIIGAPCCAQFAVSKARIRSIPKAKFQKYRDWLINTSEDNWISGRVFEYLWHKIFAGITTLCPNARVCYCDGYGVCFGSSETYNHWFEQFHLWTTDQADLDKWEAKAAAIDKIKDWKAANIEEMDLDIPLPGGDRELRRAIAERRQLLVNIRDDAMRNGTDPEFRARIAGRQWKPGDGY